MILVVGATGLLGGAITSMLLAKGHQVRILARENSPSEQMAKAGMATSLAGLTSAGAQPVYGDLKLRSSLDSACRGIETVVTTANSALRGGADNVDTVDLKGNQDLIAAAKAAGVKHFIFTSMLGASIDHPAPFFSAKARAEMALKESGMDFTILAPNVFMDIWVGAVVMAPLQQRNLVTLLSPASHRHSFVALKDVAAYAVASVDSTAARNAYLPIGGPDALSWRDVTKRLGGVLGRDVPVQLVDKPELVPGIPPAMTAMLAGFETYESPMNMGALSATYGIVPTSIESFF